MITFQEHSATETTKLPVQVAEPKLLQIIRAILQPTERLERYQKKYGDIFISHFPDYPTQVVISHPQAIQELFTADSKLFETGPATAIMEPLLGANSLVLIDGDHHKQQRKLLMPHFHGERMKAYGNLMCEITNQITSQWQIEQPFTARLSMQEISLSVILRAVFGLQQGERYQQIKQAIVTTFDTFNKPIHSLFLLFKPLQRDLGDWSLWGKFIRRRQQFDELVYKEIQERRHQPEGEDILSLLLSARDENGQTMSDVELRDELMTMLFGGHETTAVALTWALYWIHYHPEVGEKLRQELNSIDIANADPVTIAQLPYLSAICSETLRIYPPVLFSFSRTLQAPMQFMGYNLPKGMSISACIYLTHHRPDIYPEPKRFRPERFLERQFSPYEFLPFGGGHRRCLGMAFALFEMKLVLATILSHYSLQLLEKAPVKPVRRGLLYAPIGGVRLMVKEKF